MERIKYYWITQGGFIFDINNIRIIIDPYLSNSVEKKEGLTRITKIPISYEKLKPDYVICTHNHLDHLDPETISKINLLYPNCIFSGPKSCINKFFELKIKSQNIQELDTLSIKNISVIPVFAKHSDPYSVGIVLKFNNKKLYITADTEYDELLVSETTTGCDIVFSCINGKWGNMSDKEAINLMKKIKPKTALPMHYGLFKENTVNPKNFIDECKQLNINSFEMEINKEYNL